jgi:preflagellin peptidase FlaK
MITEIVAASILTALSVYDIRRRELPEKPTLLSLALIVALRLVEGIGFEERLLKAYIALDIIVLLMLAALALIGYLGWGDVVVSAIIAAASPLPAYRVILFPPILVVIAYYIVMVLLGSLSLAIINVAKNRKLLSTLPPRYRILYTFLARPVKASEIVRGRVKWWYPLTLCGEYRLHFNIYLNPDDVRREVARAISKNCLKPNDYVWVTYGVPAVPLLAAAYILTLALGDTLLLKLLAHGSIR